MEKLHVLCRNVYYHETMCHMQNLGLLLQGQGVTKGSKVKNRDNVICISIILTSYRHSGYTSANYMTLVEV